MPYQQYLHLLDEGEFHQVGKQQELLIETSIIASKKAELKNYVELGLSAVAPFYANPMPSDETLVAQLLISARLRGGVVASA